MSAAIDFPKRRGRLTQIFFCFVLITLFVYEISSLLSIYIFEFIASVNAVFPGLT